jgi:hypothetical protein
MVPKKNWQPTAVGMKKGHSLKKKKLTGTGKQFIVLFTYADKKRLFEILHQKSI